MIKKFFGIAGKISGLIILSSIIGLFMLVLVYLLPSKPMMEHTLESIEVFYSEGVYPQLVAGFKGSQLDNETDAIMTLNAIYSGTDRNVLEKAVAVPRMTTPGENSRFRELVAYIWEGQEPNGTEEYGRYWHGYLVILKPLLLLFSYADIRYLNMFAQMILLTYVIVLFVNSGLKRYLIALIASILAINPVAVAMSMQFSTIYYLVLLSFIFILSKRKWLLNKNNYIYFFLILGIITVYFDFLTYPTATLTMSLVLYLLIERLEEKKPLSLALIKLVKSSFFWGIGYLGMWITKWIYCYIVLDYNIVAEVLGRIKVHSGEAVVQGESLNVIEVIAKNVQVVARMPYLILALVIIVYLIKLFLKQSNKTVNIISIVPFIVIALIPIIWLTLTKSHAGWIYWYTSRGLMGTVFAMISAALYMLEQNKA